jgi:hypothetical protein
MGRGRRFARLMFAVTAALAAAGASRAATINASTPYLNGANIPWRAFGMDFGTHPNWGAGYDPAWWNDAFSNMKAYGLNAARIWVHCDGRASPEFDAAGDVTGLDANFIPNLQDMLDKAQTHGIRVQLCLWSFDMLNRNSRAGGGMHASLITNPSHRSNYITRALNPMLDGIASKPALAIIEVINEPEWGIAETPAETTQSVTLNEMRAFVAAIASAVHAKSSRLHVTVGSASAKWSTANGLDATEGDWWSGLGLDHREIHYYEWMVGPTWNFDPFHPGHTPAYYGWNQPGVIGEFGGNGDAPYTSVSQQMENAWTNGYAGHMPWTYAGVDGNGSFDDFKAASLSFARNHLGFTGSVQSVVYGFETSTQNWGFKSGSGSVATSTAQHQGSGTSSLAVTFSSATTARVGVDAPANSPAGKTITFWVWVPRRSAISGVYGYVQDSAGTLTQGPTKSASALTKPGWNSVTVNAPAGQTVQQIGVGFTFSSAYSGTFYIDSVTY